jgi:hypothetical protein
MCAGESTELCYQRETGFLPWEQGERLSHSFTLQIIQFQRMKTYCVYLVRNVDYGLRLFVQSFQYVGL